MTIHFWKTENGWKIGKWLCKWCELQIKYLWSGTDTKERPAQSHPHPRKVHGSQVLGTGQVGENTWSKSVHEGICPFPYSYHLPTGSRLCFRWRYWKASGLRDSRYKGRPEWGPSVKIGRLSEGQHWLVDSLCNFCDVHTTPTPKEDTGVISGSIKWL